MAFDMYCDDQRAYIDHHEEGILDFVSERDHPRLGVIKRDFYGDPVFSPSEANEIVHELISLRLLLQNDKPHQYLVSLIDRLIPFFSKAYTKGVEVRCAGD